MWYLSSFTSPVGDPHGTKGSRFRLLRRITVDIITPCDLKTLKSSSLNFLLQLCFQQSAGNSACPEIEVVPSAVGNLFLHQDIGDQEDDISFCGLWRLQNDFLGNNMMEFVWIHSIQDQAISIHQNV
jgi:hypothetical protein